jgi:hypothetical protein
VRGFSAFASSHPDRVLACKLEREIQVEFTPVARTITTPEGAIRAQAGDAIVTGSSGEHWPVSRARFAGRYRPVPPTLDGEAGRYMSLPNRVIGVPMKEPFEVVLLDGVSRLHGHSGDWLIDYGDGSLGVISPAIFAATYQIEN